VSLGVGAPSYAEQFNITVVADRDAYPGLDVFVTGARNELRALAADRCVWTAPRDGTSGPTGTGRRPPMVEERAQ
jgi:hypothetical protein